MKRVKCVWLSAFLVFLILALGGCKGKESESVTAEGLLKEAREKMESVSSTSGNVKMDVAVSYKESGLSGSLSLTADLDMKATMEPRASYMKGSVSLLGMNIEMESYGVLEGDKTVTYTNVMDQWTKDESDDMFSANEMKDILKNFNAEDLGLALAEDTEEFEGKDAYVITGELKGDMLSEMMKASENALGGVAGDIGEDLDYSKMSADMKILIYKDSRQVAQIAIDMQGLNEMAGLGDEVSIEKCNVEISYYSFDDVEEIKVPEEAKSAASSGGSDGLDLFEGMEGPETGSPDVPTGPLKPEGSGSLNNGELVQDDQGNYLLEGHYDDITATMAVPEGFAIDLENSDPDCLIFDLVQDNYEKQMYVLCTVYLLEPDFGEDVFSEDHKKDVLEMSSDSSYTDVQLSEVQTVMAGDWEVKYTKLSHTYAGSLRTVEYNTWAIQDGNKIISCDFVEQSYNGECDLAPDMEAVIASLYSGIRIN
ncbi:MAG: hypothetical protein HFI93_07490 [Lachnospiraceae bacterium]|nr:hypothetical protein [Lachnospiraceae bacterium]